VDSLHVVQEVKAFQDFPAHNRDLVLIKPLVVLFLLRWALVCCRGTFASLLAPFSAHNKTNAALPPLLREITRFEDNELLAVLHSSMRWWPLSRHQRPTQKGMFAEGGLGPNITAGFRLHMSDDFGPFRGSNTRLGSYHECA
jgi:hypothetical protein